MNADGWSIRDTRVICGDTFAIYWWRSDTLCVYTTNVGSYTCACAAFNNFNYFNIKVESVYVFGFGCQIKRIPTGIKHMCANKVANFITVSLFTCSADFRLSHAYNCCLRCVLTVSRVDRARQDLHDFEMISVLDQEGAHIVWIYAFKHRSPALLSTFWVF